jgi:hypothetical protein
VRKNCIFKKGFNTKMNFRILALFLPLLLVQCKPSPELSANERTQRLLVNKDWDMTIVTVDGIARSIYPGLSLNFQQSVYTSVNGLDVFPASGTWRFSGSDGKLIIRDDGLEITIESIDDGQLILSFYWADSNFVGGRKSELAGSHRLTFRKRL